MFRPPIEELLPLVDVIVKFQVSSNEATSAIDLLFEIDLPEKILTLVEESR